jgi:hypothetical protein
LACYGVGGGAMIPYDMNVVLFCRDHPLLSQRLDYGDVCVFHGESYAGLFAEDYATYETFHVVSLSSPPLLWNLVA